MPLQVKDAAGNIVSIMTPDEVSTATVAALTSVLQALQAQATAAQAQPVSGTVAVSNLPANYPAAATVAKVEEVRVLLAGAPTATEQTTANNILASIEEYAAAAATDAKLESLLTKIDALLTSQASLITAIGLQAKLTDPQPIAGMVSVSPDVTAAREATQQDVRTLVDTVVLLVETIRNNMPMPDGADRMRCNVETGTINVGTITTLPTLAAVTTLGNQTNMGGYSVAGLAMSGFNVPALETLTRQVIVS